MKDRRAGKIELALLAALAAFTVISGVFVVMQALTAQPIMLPGLVIDRLSALIALLVVGVGTVSYRFALRYLDGEPSQRRLLRWFFVTVAAAYVLMPANNLLLLFGAWLVTSVGLHQLLTFYGDRREAHPPARKKFLISRLGDLTLLAAIFLIAWQWGTLDLREFLARVDEPTRWPLAAGAVAMLLVLTALTKSAQFPFHSWLPETMESPTPVSALMHAGIINAGGVLLLHFATLLVRVPEALFVLALAGTVTVTLGTITMWAQTTVKRTLAWSTVAQMGFMMVQLGLAVFPAAALHLIGHGCYKAWSFLRTGELPAPAPAPVKLAPRRALAVWLVGVVVAVPALALAATLTGFTPLHSPGELALSAVVALAIGQLWVAWFQAAPTRRGALITVLSALGSSAVVALGAFTLYHGAASYLAPVLGPLQAPSGPWAWASAALPVVALLALSLLALLLPTLGRTAHGRAFYVHALHGFYVGALADRLVARIWSDRITSGGEHA